MGHVGFRFIQETNLQITIDKVVTGCRMGYVATWPIQKIDKPFAFHTMEEEEPGCGM